MTSSFPSKISFRRGMAIIIAITVVISGAFGLGLFYYQHVRDLYANNDAHLIAAIVQTSQSKELLKTAYLAELMDLSIDKPTNLYRFNTKEARKKLLKSPLIKEATVTKIRPGTVYVDYYLRQPIAFLIDYTNTAIDSEGHLLPFKPFFTPKKLPEIHLGIKEMKGWGTSLHEPRMDLAMTLLSYIGQHCCSDSTSLRRIDVVNAFASSCGQREIVVMLEDQIEKEANGKTVFLVVPWILRLDVKEYGAGLENFLLLRRKVLEQDVVDASGKTVIRENPMIVDLRLPHLAFINNLP